MCACAALINALRSLQDKVKALELERVAAAERYKNLKEETNRQLEAAASPSRKTASQSRVVGDRASGEEEEGVPTTSSGTYCMYVDDLQLGSCVCAYHNTLYYIVR